MNLLAQVLGLGNMLRGNVKRTLRDPVGHANAQMGAFDDGVKAAAATGDANALTQALGVGPGAMGGGLVGATVYHGSPYKFTKFDPTKIGSGEGAQAYGYGHYVAENPAVAQEYMLKGQQGVGSISRYHGQSLPQSAWKEISPVMRKHDMAGDIMPNQTEAGMVRSLIDEYGSRLSPQERATLEKYALPPGALYKIDLPDEAIAKMLDWDKPLSQQAPSVMQGISRLPKGYVTGSMGERRFLDPGASQRTGEGLLSDLQMFRRGRPEEMLAAQGIPGIRYLDQGSRGAGQGTSNYVVFPGNEDLLRILEVNGNKLTDMLR